MTTKAITQSDLQNLEKSIKLEIREQEKQDRHNLDNKLWTYFFKVDELDKKSAVNDNILENMTEKIEKLENTINEWFEKITQKIDWFQYKFATKEEHQDNKKEIEIMKDSHRKIITWLIWTLWTALVWFIWLVIKTLWIK